MAYKTSATNVGILKTAVYFMLKCLIKIKLNVK